MYIDPIAIKEIVPMEDVENVKDAITEVIHKYGIMIDFDELSKMRRGCRNDYVQGYKDRRADEKKFDMVAVVRCKNCKRGTWRQEEGCLPAVKCKKWDAIMNEDDYCSCAESAKARVLDSFLPEEDPDLPGVNYGK